MYKQYITSFTLFLIMSSTGISQNVFWESVAGDRMQQILPQKLVVNGNANGYTYSALNVIGDEGLKLLRTDNLTIMAEFRLNNSSEFEIVGADNVSLVFRSLGNHAYEGFKFHDEFGNELFRIQNNGNLGIGTTTPQAKLDIVGSTIIRNDGEISPFLSIGRGGNVSNAGEIRMLENTSGNWEAGFGFRFKLNGVDNTLQLESTGGSNQKKKF